MYLLRDSKIIFKGAQPPTFEVRGLEPPLCPRGSYDHDTICGNVAEMVLVTEEQSDLDEMENEEMDESVQDTPTELLKIKRWSQT